jgi:hypothetical protein
MRLFSKYTACVVASLSVLAPLSAYGETPADRAGELVRLYDELNTFKDTEAFATYGFGTAGPYAEWMDRVKDGREEAGFFIGSGFHCSTGQLLSYALELLAIDGEVDNWTVETTLEDFEGCRERLENS